MNCVLEIETPSTMAAGQVSGEGIARICLEPSGNNVVLEFNRIASILDRIENHSSTSGYSVVRVNAQVIPQLIEPFTDSDSLESVVGLLVLAFPEVHFQFCNVYVQSDGSSDVDSSLVLKAINRAKSALACPESFSPILDPFGLRSWILWRHGRSDLYPGTKAGSNAGGMGLINRHQLRFRSDAVDALDDTPTPKCAVVLEDETTYALFVGYCCYRFGCLTQLLSSSEAATNRLSEHTEEGAPYLAVQDIWLNFSISSSVHLDVRRDRYRIWPKLASARNRVTISTDDWEDSESQDGEVIRKPFPGMFEFWRYVPGWKKNSNVDDRFLQPYGLFPLLADNAYSGPRSHAAPARLLLVGELLIQRANSKLSEAVSMQDTILGAVLAGDAADLLAGRAVTASLEALSLKHEFEVLAECQFMGVRMEMSIEDRFTEIEESVKRLVIRVAPEDRESIRDSALMEISTRIGRVFRERGRFQEELDVQIHYRRYFQSFLWAQRNLESKVKSALLRYPHFLLESLSRFALVLLVLIVAFTDLHIGISSAKELQAHCASNTLACYSEYGLHTLASFLNNQLWDDEHRVWRLVLVFVGIFHLGVLLTYFYNAVSRK